MTLCRNKGQLYASNEDLYSTNEDLYAPNENLFGVCENIYRSAENLFGTNENLFGVYERRLATGENIYIMNFEQQQEVREQIRLEVARGSAPRAVIIEDALETFMDEEFELEEGVVAQMADEELERHAREQANWDGPTDCDLLDRAFAELEQSGIVARQDFTCCTTCGLAEIGDDVDDFNTRDGFVFYHGQDTERAVEGGGVYLSYGVFGGDETGSLAIGNRAVEALKTAGLQPDWDGSFQKKIYVPLAWKKRRAVSEDLSDDE